MTELDPALVYVYAGLLKPHERIMGLDLPHGGHLSHGYQTPTKKISMVSSYFETLPYRVNEKTGYVDYENLAKLADLYRPKILIAGASAYPRHYDYAKMKEARLAAVIQGLIFVDRQQCGCLPFVGYGAHQWPGGCRRSALAL